jgi:hypothetical protein
VATIKELADAEAERAEAETDDDDAEPDAEDGDAEAEPDDDDGDDDDDGAPAAPPSQQQLERAVDQIASAGDEYVAHVHAIQHEVNTGLVECPLCPVPGFVSELPMTEVDPMQRLAVLTVLGEAGTTAAPPHPTLHRCEACDGFGLMDTGSRREAFATQPCPQCGGNGYIDQQVLQAQVDARIGSGLPAGFDLTPPPAPTNNVVPTPTVTQGGHTFPVVLGGALDQFGRMAGHPLWGQPVEAGGL